jgi:hypothetical protein
MTDTTVRPPHAPRQAKKPARRLIRRPKAARNVAAPTHLARYMLYSNDSNVLDIDKMTK